MSAPDRLLTEEEKKNRPQTYEKGVQVYNRVKFLRQEIQLISESSFQRKLISDDTYRGYQDFLEGPVNWNITMDMLGTMRDFAAHHSAHASQIADQIRQAFLENTISSEDEKTLMSLLVLKNEMTLVDDFPRIQKYTEQELKRYKEMKAEYIQFTQHSLCKTSGVLEVDAYTRIFLLDEASFMELPSEERRKKLEELKTALPKAEFFAKQKEEKEKEHRRLEINKQLNVAESGKVLGDAERKVILQHYETLDTQKQQEFIQDLTAQLKRHQDLWSEIQEVVPGMKELRR